MFIASHTARGIHTLRESGEGAEAYRNVAGIVKKNFGGRKL